MKQQQYRGFGLILSVVLMVIVVSTLFSRNNDALSEQEYYQALEAGNYEQVWVKQNEAAPTGKVELHYPGGGVSSVYVSDVVEAQDQLKSRGIDYTLFDVPQENYVLSIFLPVILSAVVIMVIFNIMNIQENIRLLEQEFPKDFCWRGRLVRVKPCLQRR